MRILLDSADPAEAEGWMAKGVVAGGTTNPLLLRKEHEDGRPLRRYIEPLAKAYHPLPLSVEIATLESSDAMINEGCVISSWADNIVVKIPIVRPDEGDLLDVIHGLAERGVRVNATACVTPAQAWLAAQAGAAYASILWGRVLDEAGDPVRAVALYRQWSATTDPTAELILGSIRSVGDAYEAMGSGADFITLPPAILAAFCHHGMATKTAQQFFAAAR